MDLELALGITCSTLSSLTFDSVNGLVAYPASGVLVLFNPSINCQVGHLHIPKNAISCACFSPDGKYVATGEIGYKPAVRVWRLQDATEVVAFYAHETGITSVLFSPKGDIIVSVGLENSDVNVWTWIKRYRIGTNTVKSVLYSAAFSSCGTFFVTAGVRHLKFWYPGLTRRLAETTLVPTVLPLVGRPVILRNYRDSTFVCVCCGSEDSCNYAYVVTKTGALVILMASTRQLINVKRLPDTKLTCLTVKNQSLFLGADNGDIQIFNALSLTHMIHIPCPMFSDVHNTGVTTMVFDSGSRWLTAIYDKTNISIWKTKQDNSIEHTFLATYHRNCITALDKLAGRGDKHDHQETFVTSSYDITVRCTGLLCAETISYDALRVLDCRGDDANSSKAEATVSEDDQISALCVCFGGSGSDSGHCEIVTGSRGGKICVYDEESFRLLIAVMAHTEEVTVLASYSASYNCILVSGSRDHLIHVMDVNNKYHLMQTLDFHTSGIRAINIFSFGGGTIYMFSVSSDRFLNVYGAPIVPSSMMFQQVKCLPIVSTPCDITTHKGRREVVLACLDGNVRVLDFAKLQPRRMFKGFTGEDAQVSKMALDPMGVLLVTATTNKTINVLNYKNGDVLVSMIGHAKPVTGLAFTFTGDHLITTAMDGCLFAWRLSDKLRATQDELATGFAMVSDDVKGAMHKDDLSKIRTLKVEHFAPRRLDSFTSDAYFTAECGEGF